jgi:outer membrane protein, heavy metal efflux system
MGQSTKALLTTGLGLLLACQTGCGLLGPSRPQNQFIPALGPSRTACFQPLPDLTAAGQSVVQQASFKPATLQPPIDLNLVQNRSSVHVEELTVDTVVQEVLARNPTVTQMVAAWQVASEKYPQVTSLDDPSLDLALAPASIGSNNVDFGGRIGISQKIPLGGKLGLRGQAAQFEASAAGNDVNDTRLQLVESAKSAFYEYFVVHRAQAVNEENLSLLTEAHKSAENRVATGKFSQQELIQIDVEIDKQRERTLTLERMRQVAVGRLNTLMHRSPDGVLPPPPATLAVQVGLPPVEELRARAVQLRPDLRALADRVSADETSLAAIRRDYLPDLMIGAAYDSIMGNGQSRDLAPQVNAGINIPLRLSKRNAAVCEAEARLAQRRAELARLVDQVNFQVHEAYAQVVEAEKVVHLYEKTTLRDAESNVKAAGNAYTVGQIPLMSLLQAQRDLVGVRDRYYQAIADYFQRRAVLERAVGDIAGDGRPLSG